MNDLQDGYALGLDLGTTYSCIGVYRKGGVEIIPNRNGEKTTPSIVTILDENTIIKGEDSIEYLVKEYNSSIYAVKRFIGRRTIEEDVKEEINKENFPFKIIWDEKGKYNQVLINKKNQKIKFTLEEISSFVISKMVENAEMYLGKKVKSLVITVPANFNDSQRNCTKQAAKLAGVNVLRIINEPTAAALAYGLGQKDNLIKEYKETKILVFDLGGGTFDVTILKINKGEEQIFEIMSTKGDKYLGGEDFDNKLVEYVLDRFCQKTEESKEKIKQDKKSIKKLKLACEKTKRVLSSSLETTLFISNFYNGNDILEIIRRKEFEDICEDLFNKLKIPLNEALVDAKLTKDEIDEIVLVGGSSRIPKIKIFLQNYFNITEKNNKSRIKINDTINPDETVAYGATLMAAKILIKQDKNLKAFSLMDITPLSLGVEILNESKIPEIQNEGNLMSVIIKRGTKIPFSNTETYQTVKDNQTVADIVIYEGERKYIKYNHILGDVELSGLPQKKKGEVKIDVKFFVDVDGILTVTATEQSTRKSINAKIKNDNVGLTDEDIKKLIEKNKKLYKKINSISKKEKDYSNLKESIKEFQAAYNESDNDEDRYDILNNYNEVLKEFIDLFDKNFDNETMVEKYYIYVKELINSYIKTLNMKKYIDKETKINIMKNIKEFIDIFVKQSSGYLDDIVEILKELNKNDFYEIIVIIMEKLNECGKNCLKERKRFCKYNSLMFFEKANLLFKKYIIDIKKLAICGRDIMEKCKNQKAISESYIIDINSNAILLNDGSLKLNQLLESNLTGFTNNILGLKISSKDELEKYQIVLRNYEKMLIELSDRITEERAICIANIVKISIKLLGDTKYKKYIELCKTCEFIAKQLQINNDKQWYKEFKKIYADIEDNYNMLNINQKEMKERIKKKYKYKFDEIDDKFAKKKGNLDFIHFILIFKPYKGYEEDKKKGKKNFNQDSQDLIKYLIEKYYPDDYQYTMDNEESQLNYCIIEYIEAYLNKLFINIQ